jgi:hypothetical protein
MRWRQVKRESGMGGILARVRTDRRVTLRAVRRLHDTLWHPGREQPGNTAPNAGSPKPGKQSFHDPRC